MTDAVEQEILAFMRKIKPEHASIDAHTDLIGGGILDSLAVLQLVSFVTERFAVMVPARDLTTANLRSAATLAKLVEARRVRR